MLQYLLLSKLQNVFSSKPVKCDYRKTVDVWRTLLEETEQCRKVRLEALESCLEKICNDCKRMKTDRANCVKMVCYRKVICC